MLSKPVLSLNPIFYSSALASLPVVPEPEVYPTVTAYQLSSLSSHVACCCCCLPPAGYGLAVANAQHTAAALATMLKGNGVSVEWGVHPVAGRMPGQLVREGPLVGSAL
jgi:hypothetical protein